MIINYGSNIARSQFTSELRMGKNKSKCDIKTGKLPEHRQFQCDVHKEGVHGTIHVSIAKILTFAELCTTCQHWSRKTFKTHCIKDTLSQ